jgi:hypothetical protein
MATMAVVQMAECNDNGGSCADNNAAALLAVPCLHQLPQQWQRHEQWCARTKGGNDVDDGALVASSAISCSDAQWGSRQ